MFFLGGIAALWMVATTLATHSSVLSAQQTALTSLQVDINQSELRRERWQDEIGKTIASISNDVAGLKGAQTR